MKSVLIIFFFFLVKTNSLFAQQTNAYKFIEPNISFSYDSNMYKIGQRYSNSVYETESYDIKFIQDKSMHARFNIKAHAAYPGLTSREVMDSILMANHYKAKTIEDDTLKIIDMDSTLRHVDEFSCLGFLVENLMIHRNFSTVICNHVSENDMTQINYISYRSKGLLTDYKIIEGLLKGFKSYSKEQIEKEEIDIRKKYTVSISTTKDTSEFFKFRNMSYVGIVKVNEPLQHRIKEARLSFTTVSGEEIFYPAANGEVLIACRDSRKGLIERKGDLIILNSFGKNVKIPFTFTYYNK